MVKGRQIQGIIKVIVISQLGVHKYLVEFS